MMGAGWLAVAFVAGVIVRGFWRTTQTADCTLSAELMWLGQKIRLQVTMPTMDEAQRAMRHLMGQLMVAEAKAPAATPKGGANADS